MTGLVFASGCCDSKPSPPPRKERPDVGETGFVYYKSSDAEVPLLSTEEHFRALERAVVAQDKEAVRRTLDRAILLGSGTEVTALGIYSGAYRVRVTKGLATGREGFVTFSEVHLDAKRSGRP
jgi:hypothetical protein